MAKSNSGVQVVLAIGGVAAVILFLPRLLSAAQQKRAANTPASTGQNDQSLGQTLKAILEKLGRGSSGGRGSSSPLGGNGLNQAARTAAGGSRRLESIAQALFTGNTGVDQNVLAQIFNAQHGYYGDQTVAQQGQSWLDQFGWNLGDLFSTQENSLPYEQTQLFDLTGAERSVFGNYPTETPGLDSRWLADPVINAGGGQDWSNYDWSGGNNGWDIGGGSSGGGSTDRSQYLDVLNFEIPDPFLVN